MRIYEVELNVIGDITTRRTISLTTDKELNLGNIFRSDIEVEKHQLGLKVVSTVFTENEDRAHKVALLFIGKMLDVLSIRTRKGLFITSEDYKKVNQRRPVIAVVDKEEILLSFKLSRRLNLEYTPILRALNWYRKGLYTEDPFDKFLALWNSINVIASSYHNRGNERTRAGIINQIYDCFITLWGADSNNWQYINGEEQWIDSNNRLRNDIAHGLIHIEVDSINRVISRLQSLEQVAYGFIVEWAQRQQNVRIVD
ncbi:MAG: hypothetical protein JNL72_02560 [Flavipsychrobacter sp.]|nr:hypothetical protein [Flavipsychrobacter sp.]